jgi:chromosome segregation ATPase
MALEEDRADVRRRASAARDHGAQLQQRVGDLRDSIRASSEKWVQQQVDTAGLQVGAEMLAEQLAAAKERIANLERALETNRHIAMAIGILMARGAMTEDQAFERLRQLSQRRHVKLRDVAEEVVYTGDAVG